MGNPEGRGYIVYICRRCGFIFELQGWGDNRLTSKYKGILSPGDIARYYPRCPRCGAPLSPKPVIEIHTLREVDVEKALKEYKGVEEDGEVVQVHG